MAADTRNGPTVIAMKVSGKMGRCTDMVRLPMQMETKKKVIGKMIDL